MSPVATRQPGWADTLTERASAFIDRRTSRRGFIGRTALVGSALTVAGSTYVLKPTSAYAATCSCVGRTCNCADLCCDGYTEFCCHVYGENSCPPNTILAGWWKVNGNKTPYCNGADRYYMDCNKRVSCTRCSGGVCKDGSTICQCRACGNRKDGCTMFRYGNCNNDVACVGPIMCRVVTCTKPWEIDPGCSQAERTDDNTAYHHRPCLEPAPEPTDTQRSLVRAFYADYLRRSPTDADVEFWARKLAGGRSVTAVSSDFAHTDEYVGRFVDDLYLSVFGRKADAGGKRNWTNQIQAGMLPSEVAARLYGSQEFFESVGSVEAYVDALYREILGREPDDEGRQHWIRHIEAGTPRRTVAKQFYGSTESRQRRVRGLYQRFLRRTADPEGLQTWTTILGENGGDDLALATFLTGSQEYETKAKQRFPNGGPPPTTTSTTSTTTTSTSTTTTTTTTTAPGS